MKRRAYKINAIIINKTKVEEVVIDPHVDKHADHISDELILDLVAELVHTNHIAEEDSENFQYFVSEIAYNSKLY